VRVCLLASGSKGNSVYIETGGTRFLIDAGCSAREIAQRLLRIDVDPSTLDAVLVTHEHGDHISGVGTLARRLKIPVLISYATLAKSCSLFAKTSLVEFESGYSFTFRDIQIDPFPITHDAVDPVGFVLEGNEGKVGVATDLGIVTRLVTDKLKGCRVLVVEANHDEEMLLNGPYPWHLKQRIRSRHGHLSNADSVALIEEVIHEELHGVFLAHLSEVNNHPDRVTETSVSYLQNQDLCSPSIVIGSQYEVSKVLTF
jgi:phosphoribosyl 1,2-cyclic phosphodiesterase